MQDFPSNSRKAAQGRPDEPKKLERITSAEAVRRKRGLGRQFRETFINGNAKTAGEYMLVEVVVPAIKDGIMDALHAGIDAFFTGDARPRRRSSPSVYTNERPHVNYQGVYPSHNPPRARHSTQMLSPRSRSRHDFDEIIIQSRQEANDVIDQLYDILSRYGSVPVADLYALTGIKPDHTDYKWGWIDLRGAKARTLSNNRGFLLELPDPQPLT